MNQNKRYLKRSGRETIDGYNYYISDDYLEDNPDLSGRSTDTFKFARPTFGDCLVNRAEQQLSNVESRSTSSGICSWNSENISDNRKSNEKKSSKSSKKGLYDMVQSEYTTPGRHDIRDLLQEIASESSDIESGSESQDETIEQYYARLRMNASKNVEEMSKKYSENSQISSPPKMKSTADEIRAMDPDENIFDMTDNEEPKGNDDADANDKIQEEEEDNIPEMSKTKQKEELEYYELYHDSKFGLKDGLYDEDLDDADEKYVNDNKLKKAENSDAILSCSKCFAVFTYDCQRHTTYQHQYRSMFVVNENVKLVPDKIIKFRKKEIGKDGKRRRITKKSLARKEQNLKRNLDVQAIQASEKSITSEKTKTDTTKNKMRPNEFSSKKKIVKEVDVDDESCSEMELIPENTEKDSNDQSSNIGDSALYDHYFQVVCADCQNEIAYYDRDDVYHFYNVIAS